MLRAQPLVSTAALAPPRPRSCHQPHVRREACSLLRSWRTSLGGGSSAALGAMPRVLAVCSPICVPGHQKPLYEMSSHQAHSPRHLEAGVTRGAPRTNGASWSAARASDASPSSASRPQRAAPVTSTLPRTSCSTRLVLKGGPDAASRPPRRAGQSSPLATPCSQSAPARSRRAWTPTSEADPPPAAWSSPRCPSGSQARALRPSSIRRANSTGSRAHLLRPAWHPSRRAPPEPGLPLRCGASPRRPPTRLRQTRRRC
mmetsp:Transcript_44640/g.123716  ORF Transcript_44640/g.123716 Transcript_44640/m.123716 type:complete len:258 (-) Transcript_44640:1414-2187(-)